VTNNVKVQRQTASTNLGNITPDRPSQAAQPHRDQRATS
jgi:hypothetical protein